MSAITSKIDKSSCSAKLTIDKINEKVKDKNLICISTIYVGNKNPLEWKCSICNGIFTRSFNEVDRHFTKCPECKKLASWKLAEMEVAQRGGKLLDNHYILSTTKLHIICKNNHDFYISYANLVSVGHWCPLCSKNNNISEEICRAYFEQMFNEKFPSIRPDWLKNYTGRNLELDGYCSTFNLAFEHQGEHHYEDIFDSGRLELTTKNDQTKINICNKMGVNLIVIPQLFNKTPLKSLKDLILQEADKLNVIVPFSNIQINLENCYNSNKIDYFQECKDIAINKGGKCISIEYLGGSNQKLIWECKNGHQWEQFPYVVKKGNWCDDCNKYSIKDAHKLAIDNGGICLSETMRNSSEKLYWQCRFNHTWSASLRSAKQSKSWCPICYKESDHYCGRKYTIKDLQYFATLNEGKCLANKYINNSTEISWQCKCGSIWEQTWGSIKNAIFWCRNCRIKISEH
jgi:putative zinc ribbon protein